MANFGFARFGEDDENEEEENEFQVIKQFLEKNVTIFKIHEI